MDDALARSCYSQAGGPPRLLPGAAGGTLHRGAPYLTYNVTTWTITLPHGGGVPQSSGEPTAGETKDSRTTKCPSVMAMGSFTESGSQNGRGIGGTQGGRTRPSEGEYQRGVETSHTGGSTWTTIIRLGAQRRAVQWI